MEADKNNSDVSGDIHVGQSWVAVVVGDVLMALGFYYNPETLWQKFRNFVVIAFTAVFVVVGDVLMALGFYYNPGASAVLSMIKTKYDLSDSHLIECTDYLVYVICHFQSDNSYAKYIFQWTYFGIDNPSRSSGSLAVLLFFFNIVAVLWLFLIVSNKFYIIFARKKSAAR